MILERCGRNLKVMISPALNYYYTIERGDMEDILKMLVKIIEEHPKD